MSWTEVHDEAEHLEHAVSDRLIERIDEMLGRPAVDPHGDPIPGPGRHGRRAATTTRLLTCPLGRSRYGPPRERSGPRVPRSSSSATSSSRGRSSRVEERDAAGRQRAAARRSDRRVHDRRARGLEGAGAGRARCSLLLLARCPRRQLAQTPAPAKPAAEPFKITDNSFLVEEAFNQEPGIFQNIFGAVAHGRRLGARPSRRNGRSSRRRTSSRTRCACARRRRRHRARRHAAQLPLPGADRRARPAGILAARRAWSCRPATRARARLGIAGLQVNLPFSKQTGDWYWHWNGGLTWLPRAESRRRPADDTPEPRCRRSSPAARSTGCGRCST